MDGAYRDKAMVSSKYERNEADFYPTPPDVTEVANRFLREHMTVGEVIWEPAAGAGDMLKAFDPIFGRFGTDLHSYGCPDVKSGYDFLEMPIGAFKNVTAIVTNPPYGDMAEYFCNAALHHLQYDPTIRIVGMLMRNEYDCAVRRQYLFNDNPFFAVKTVLTKRPRWIAGSNGSPRHNYAWYWWMKNRMFDVSRITYDR